MNEKILNENLPFLEDISRSPFLPEISRFQMILT